MKNLFNYYDTTEELAAFGAMVVVWVVLEIAFTIKILKVYVGAYWDEEAEL